MAEVRLNISDVKFNEEDEGPFNVCVIVESEDDDCPVEFEVEYTISFTRTSSHTGSCVLQILTNDKKPG